MKKIFVFALVVFAGIFFATQWERRGDKVILEQSNVARLKVTESAERFHNLRDSGQVSAEKCEQRNPITRGKNTYVVRDEAHGEALLNKAYQNPGEVLAIAEKDPEAYIALYTLTTSCFPELMRPGLAKKRIIAGCPNVTMKLNGHPIQLLERAAELGSVDAKLSFAMNARLYKKFYFVTEGGQTRDNSKDVLSRSEKYGAEAAAAGLPDAYRYMSRAYENGIFGSRDNAKALAFMLPLEKTGLLSDRDRIKNLSSKLSAEDRRRANTIAFGCIEEPSESIYKNPFQ